MTDTVALRDRIKESGLKYQWIAGRMGLSAYGLQLKIENDSEFKVSEVMMLSQILGLTPAEKDKIFFA